MQPEIGDARSFQAPLDPLSVHQGAAIEVKPLQWGNLNEICAVGTDLPMVILLDRVTDPQNVGSIIRSAKAFGARAVVAPARHSPPETGALGKAASGALESFPYLRVRNLGQAIDTLKELGYSAIGLEPKSDQNLQSAMDRVAPGPVAIALGGEKTGLRQLTKSKCGLLVHISSARKFESLNVSNAAAIALYVAAAARNKG